MDMKDVRETGDNDTPNGSPVGQAPEPRTARFGVAVERIAYLLAAPGFLALLIALVGGMAQSTWILLIGSLFPMVAIVWLFVIGGLLFTFWPRLMAGTGFDRLWRRSAVSHLVAGMIFVWSGLSWVTLGLVIWADIGRLMTLNLPAWLLPAAIGVASLPYVMLALGIPPIGAWRRDTTGRSAPN
jgi:hypothetical protein